MNAKALWHQLDLTSSLREDWLSEEKEEDSVLVKSLFSMISLGTERLVSMGNVPASLVETMKVPYQQGSLDLPVSYGYSLVGEVITPNHKLTGRKVHLLHPHHDFCRVKEADVFVIPDHIPAQRAVLASNLETAVNAIWDSGVSIGDRVLVAGLGNVGALLSLCLSQMPGIHISVVEKNEERMQWAESQGFSSFIPADSPAVDIAFHTTGHAQALQQCIDAVGFEGKIMELSWYGEKEISLQLGGSFHHQRKQLVSSQVGHLPANRTGRWDFKRRKELVFDLLQNPIFDQIPTVVYPFEEAPDLFDRIRKEPNKLPMVNVFAYGKRGETSDERLKTKL